MVGELAGATVAVPPKGWGTEGAIVGEKGMVEWAVLDAQWFGVAQRRRRVFAFADFGDWAGRQPVLLIPESLRGDTAPRREAGQDVAPTISARTNGGGGLGTDFDLDGGLLGSGVREVSLCLNGGGMGRIDYESETLIPTNGGGFDVAHSLSADGFDASEDGTGRGTPLIPVAHVETMPTLRAAAAQYGPGHGARSGDSKDEFIVPVAFDLRNVTSPVNQSNPQGGDPCHTLHKPKDSVIVSPVQVRRLAPRECERLQGFPDDYTLVLYRGKPAADGPRYKALGNSMCTKVMRYIGEQIELIRCFQ